MPKDRDIPETKKEPDGQPEPKSVSAPEPPEPKISIREFADGASQSRTLLAGFIQYCKTSGGPVRRTRADWAAELKAWSEKPA